MDIEKLPLDPLGKSKPSSSDPLSESEKTQDTLSYVFALQRQVRELQTQISPTVLVESGTAPVATPTDFYGCFKYVTILGNSYLYVYATGAGWKRTLLS